MLTGAESAQLPASPQRCVWVGWFFQEAAAVSSRIGSVQVKAIYCASSVHDNGNTSPDAQGHPGYFQCTRSVVEILPGESLTPNSAANVSLLAVAEGWIRRAIEEKLQRETGFSALSVRRRWDTQLFFRGGKIWHGTNVESTRKQAKSLHLNESISASICSIVVAVLRQMQEI